MLVTMWVINFRATGLSIQVEECFISPVGKIMINTVNLKAKGIADLEERLDKKQKIPGQKSKRQTARYDRKIQTVPLPGNQEKSIARHTHKKHVRKGISGTKKPPCGGSTTLHNVLVFIRFYR